MSKSIMRGRHEVRSDINRMALLARRKLSFGSAVMLGLAASSVSSPNQLVIRYNGAGFKGDMRAVRADFDTALGRARKPA